MRTSSLTPTHERIARAILNLERRHEPAFVSDLVRNLGYAAESSLTATLHLMERKGFLLLQGGGARGRSRVARLTPQGRMAIGAGGLPLLGFIPAGPLTEALQQADDFVEPEELFPYRDGDFLLRVKGDSMIGDGILDGDKVLLRPGVEARQGEIAAVLVGESYESTLKHLYVDKETVILRASNPKYPDLSVPAESVSIAGVFRGLIRQSAA